MSEASLTHAFQYSIARHQSESAISGMWLFLATEVLFFGALFLSWISSRHWNQAGFDLGAHQTALAIGTINTLILIASYIAWAPPRSRREIARWLIRCCAIASLLGSPF